MLEMVGPYRVVEELGRGGMGIVYRGVHDRLERNVAIKQLAPELTSNPHFKERFFAEAKTQAQLQHPNIVAIYDLIEEGGEFFIVMEYFPGRGLDELVAENQGRGLGEERTLAIFRQVLAALDSAHSLGVIHRDVKPSNVLLDGGGKVKLMDFGIALLVGDKRLTQSSQTIGTPVYMSPEQILRPRSLDHRTDIYSAAVMLFEMLSGRAPFDAETEYEIKKLHVEAAPDAALGELTGVSPSIVQALQRALAKEPEGRFASAGEFLRALPADGSTPAPAPPPPAPAPPRATRLEEQAAPPSSRSAPPPATAGGLFSTIPKPWPWVGAAAIVLLAVLAVWLLAASRGGRPAAGREAQPTAGSTAEVSPRPPLTTPPPGPSPTTEVPEPDAESAAGTVSESEPPSPQVDAAEQARRRAEQEARIRQRLVDQTKTDLQAATRTARQLLADGKHEQAQSTVKQALARSAPYRGDLVDEVVALQVLEQEITTRIVDQRTAQESERERQRLAREAWERRIAELQGLVDDSKYPEARQLAQRLLADEELPEDLAERARQLESQAGEALKNIWGRAEVQESSSVINPRRKKDKKDDEQSP